MHLRNDMRQKNTQKNLDFNSKPTGEARTVGEEATESFSARHAPENPASTNQLMEEVCERENLKRALQRVKANKGSPGIDGMTVEELPGYLQQHWPAIREQLSSGTYAPKPVRRVEIDKPDGGGMRKLGIDYAGQIRSASSAAGSATTVGPDVLRTQLRFSTGMIGPSSGGTGTEEYCRRLQLGG
jgi:RNA-directed DNA polymerase